MTHDQTAAGEKSGEYQWTDADRASIWDHLEAEMKAGNLRYVSDERRRAASSRNTTGASHIDMPAADAVGESRLGGW